MHKNGIKFKAMVLGVAMALIGAIVGTAMAAGGSPVFASAGYASACESCHTYPAATLRVSTDAPTRTVSAGASFPVNITWSGSSGRTEINWPNTQSNTLFAPTPRVPYSASNASGSTSSTLTAPTTPGTYTLRVYAAKISPMESYYQNMTVTVTGGSALPAITTASLAAATVGISYSQTLVASGGTSPYTWSVSAGTLPAGLTLSNAGVISGTPSSASASTFTVKVVDAGSSASTRALSITVSSANSSALAITNVSLPSGTVGTAYSQTMAVSGGTPPYIWTLSVGDLPAGLIMGDDGAITGTPTAAGTSGFTVLATDNTMVFETKDLSITINSVSSGSLNITTSSLPTGALGRSYGQALAATGGQTPYTWSVSSGDLPDGLSLSSGGTINGTPNRTGTSSFSVRVRDNASNSDTQSLSITVNHGSSGSLNITTSSLPSGTVGRPYSQALAATGGRTPYTWLVSSGDLPDGLSLSSGGTISGIPNKTETSSFTVRVRDNASNSDTQSLSITVNYGSSGSLNITTSSLPSGAVGRAYSQALAATGGRTPYTWLVSSGDLPDGLSLSSGGTISGIPSRTGTSNFTVRVRDNASNSDTQSLSITVNSRSLGSLNITTSSLPSGAVGRSYSQALAATGGRTPYTWSVSSGDLPNGLSLSSGGTISGIPNRTGTSNFTVRVRDNASNSDTQSLSITVNSGSSGSLSITTSSLPSAEVDHFYSSELIGSGGTAPYLWSISSGSLPEGLLFNPSGAISGRPSDEGMHTFTVSVEDNSGASDTQNLSITVEDN